ncbi:hypothetical protein GobsT_26780 [Gemmata obscuriglobus]|uniref:DUF1553 domain-containing protein n=1 Tax=Gemmata obscuriglobus TaxID=114 RepID=A0A2Z3H3Z9_9BACT|nr:DUF1549 and DUF1553 domain-containing protein [Gemmata obscuriglobus]AWM39052.1 DUF1553 domain-containing protein [Gemmata obscuriglobus]QEG27914.1 hypothetical protein GobsT_26780 [Gemmata obscuriglobus]VTS05354.1 Uncharacterized protein OS=Isosphaera pallida (strain ATCC 43644 / DSM 9630 / IS1B) GN=Isop_2856 PE=4 SV=1: PSCyt2: PSD1 [Gemmata obscuriglobus UQM 2246]
MTRRAVPVALLALVLLAVEYAGGEPPKYADPELKPKDRAHWAFIPPKRPVLPKAPPGANPIDAFVRARLDAEGLKPSPRADKLTLIRRLTLDLTGLPPTPAEVEAFLTDERPGAYETLVDRLLASPHFGERWATHWLDVVRFAETNGYELDAERPHAWRYRDYVVNSFNADKPYDQFVREQIAGDEMADKDAKRRPELLIATGMHRCGPVHLVSGNLDQEVLRQEVLTEMVNGIGSTFLGLTFACTRCHDHKFDPLSAGDYYRLQAFFANAKYTETDFATAEQRDARNKRVEAITAKTAPLKKQIAELDAPVRAKVAKEKREKLEPRFKDALDVPADNRTPAQKALAAQAKTLTNVSWDEVLAAMAPDHLAKRAKLREQLHTLEARMPPPTPAAWAIENSGRAKTHVLRRGEAHLKSVEVQPGLPRVLVQGDASVPKTRRELADWLTAPEHPLTGRVMVNRLWQHHFGRGLVATPNDFGTRGDRPTHPELLDWLATELVESKWSLKRVHRLIVTSETYTQSATADGGAKVDPDNKLLWRMNRRRLEAEAVRDSILGAAGTLNREVGGPSVKVPLEPEVYDLIFTEGEPDGLWPVTPDVKQHTRRSVYLFNKRNVRQPLLEAFDQPDTLNSCAARPVSTFAPQALILMNSPFVHDQAKALALTLFEEAGRDPVKQVEALYRRAVGRAPNATERSLAAEFLKEQADTVRERVRAKVPVGIDSAALPKGAELAQVRALADLCVVVFNTHEFAYIP